MTLNDLEWLFRVGSIFALVCLAFNRASLENNCVKTNTDRQILSAAQIFGSDSGFWQYKVCVDIRAGSLETSRQRPVMRSRVNARLKHFFLGFRKQLRKRSVQINPYYGSVM